MAKSLKERKENLVKSWEECFELKIGDVLNKAGIEKLWDDNTSIEEADEILIAAGFSLVIDEIKEGKSIFGVAIISNYKEKLCKEGKKQETCKGGVRNDVGKFAVLRKTDNHIYADRFFTVEGAEELIRDICMHTQLTADDLSIIQEMN